VVPATVIEQAFVLLERRRVALVNERKAR